MAQLETKINQSEGDVSQLQQQLSALREEKDELYQYYQAQLDNAWQLAEDFSRIDLAQADAIYQQAFALFKEGKIGKAREVLSSQERQDNLAQLRKKEREIDEEEANIEALEEAVARQKERLKEEKEELKKGKEKEIENFILAARLAKLEFDFESAEKNLLAAVELDSTNVNNLFKLAYFCGELNQQKRAINFYQQALRFSQVEGEKATLFHNLGGELTNNNQYERAGAAYGEALEIYQRLSKANPERYEPEVAGAGGGGLPRTTWALCSLYNMYNLNAYERAAAAYSEALAIYQRLSNANPERYEPEPGQYIRRGWPYVANTQNNLGNDVPRTTSRGLMYAGQ